jgi:hypothetical protein
VGTVVVSPMNRNLSFLVNQHMTLDTITDSLSWMIGVRIPAGAGNFPRHRVQTSSGAHPASYPMATGDSFRGSKADGA